MNFKSFFTPQYLFQVNSAFVSPREKLVFLGGAVLLLLSIVLKIAAVLAPNPVDQKYRNKFYALFLTAGLFGLGWYLCRYENVTFFDSRFVLWILILIVLIWLVTLVIKTFMNYGPEKKLWEKEQVRQKYLPH